MAEAVIEILPPCTRLALRASPAVAALLSGGFGLVLPPPPRTAVQAKGRAALRLGPDEILLLAADGAAAALLPALSEAAGGVPLALVDISHGQVALRVTGPRAADLLNEGCPLDLDAAEFPPGACTRTLFGKAGIVLWRTGAAVFQVEVARSLAPWLRALLDEAAAGLA